MTKADVFLAVAATLATFAVALTMIGFATPSWKVYSVSENSDVDRERRGVQGVAYLVYLSRNEGLFTICFLSFHAELAKINPKPDPGCIYQDWEFPRTRSDVSLTENYWLRVHMMRSAIIGMLLGSVFVFLSAVFGVFGCYKQNNCHVRRSGAFAVVGALVLGASVGLIHGSMYVTDNFITQQNPNNQLPFPPTWSAVLRKATSCTYGWSYYMTLTAIVFSLLSSLFYLLSSAFYIKSQEPPTCYENQSYEVDDTAEGSNTEKEEFVTHIARDPKYCLGDPPIVYAYDSNYLKSQVSQKPAIPEKSTSFYGSNCNNSEVLEVDFHTADSSFTGKEKKRCKNTWGWRK